MPAFTAKESAMSQTVQVSFVQEGDVYTVHTGSPVLKDIVMDYTGIPEAERGGNSSALLVASALSCFCGSIRAALVAREVPFRAIRAEGTGTKEANADGAMRLTSIDISVTVDADDAYADKIAHCAKIVRNCLVTASLCEGVRVSHHVSMAGGAL